MYASKKITALTFYRRLKPSGINKTSASVRRRLLILLAVTVNTTYVTTNGVSNANSTDLLSLGLDLLCELARRADNEP